MKACEGVDKVQITKNLIILFDTNKEMRKISDQLEKIDDVDINDAKRKGQFNIAILEKFGKHDMKWLLSRLNYYSVGVRVSAKFRKREYLRETEKFLGGR